MRDTEARREREAWASSRWPFRATAATPAAAPARPAAAATGGRSAWEVERAAAERLARAEVARLEGLISRLDARTQAGQAARLASQLGTARFSVRHTLRLQDWVATLRAQQPARFRELVEELGAP